MLMTTDEKEFLRLMAKTPAHGQLAIMCVLFLGRNSSDKKAASKFLADLKAHSKEELKSAVRWIQERLPYLASVDNGIHLPLFEETIEFIRRELLAEPV